MSARERAYRILEAFNEGELQGFIMMFGSKIKPNEETEAEDTEKAERVARKRAAADRIAARRVPLPPDFDYKKEILEYLDERYGV